MTKTKRKEKEKKVRKKEVTQIIEHHVMEQNKNFEIKTHMGKVKIERQLSSRASCGLWGINSIPTHFRNFGMWLKIQVPRFGAFQTSIMCLDLYRLHYHTMVSMHLKSTKK